jgi:hypothetical protein
VEEKFYSGSTGERLRAALALFERFAAGTDAALVRLGWAGHAEAKSLAGHRRIQRPQARGAGRIASEGSTRHVIDLAGHPLPFGWALLVRADRWQAPGRWLDPARAAAPAPSAAGTPKAIIDPGTPSLRGQGLRFRKGQHVLVDGGDEGVLLEPVTWAMKDSDEVNVAFDGDSEPVAIRRIKALP